MVTAMVGLIATLAPTIGPTAGGYLTNLFSWHWLFLVNVVPGIAVTIAVLCPGRLRQAELRAPQALRLHRPRHARRLPRQPRIRARGGRRATTGSRTAPSSSSPSSPSSPALRSSARTLTASEPIVELRAFTDRNFATGSLFSFVARRRPLWPRLPLSRVSRPRARLQLAADRRDDVRHRRLHDDDGADRGRARAEGRPALDAGLRPRPVRASPVSSWCRSPRTGRSTSSSSRRRCAASR